MKSATLPSFWEAYRRLTPGVRRATKKAYTLEASMAFAAQGAAVP